MSENEIKQILEVLESYEKICKEEIKKIPLQFNLVSEVRANENAHSRILAQILRVSEENLKSFFKFLGETFQSIDAANSKIECEKHRIDILIEAKNGEKVIIENKIRNAIDQDKQIERYVDIFKIKKNKIYVIYLTNKGGSPSENSFSSNTKEIIKDRYLEINYRDHILPWLKFELLPNCQYRDRILISGIEQYINFLEIRFKKQGIYKKMNSKINESLEKNFELGGKSLNEKFKILENKIYVINELSNSVELMQKSCLIEVFKDWQNRIPAKYKNRIKSNFEDDKINSYFFLSVLFQYQNHSFSCSIGKDTISGLEFYVGLSVRGTDDEKKHDEIIKFIGNFDKEKDSPRWYLLKYPEFEKVFEEFYSILEGVEDSITK